MSKLGYSSGRGRVSLTTHTSCRARISVMFLPQYICAHFAPSLLSLPQTICIVACVLFWAVLLTIGILLIWLVRVPTATVASTTIQCATYSSCSNYATTVGIPVQVNITVSNPNILSAYVQSSDLVLTDRSSNANNGNQIATGTIARQYVESRGDSNVIAMFNFPADTVETTTVITAIYGRGENYPINVNGHLQLSVGALSFTYHLNEDETIPGQ